MGHIEVQEVIKTRDACLSSGYDWVPCNSYFLLVEEFVLPRIVICIDPERLIGLLLILSPYSLEQYARKKALNELFL